MASGGEETTPGNAPFTLHGASGVVGPVIIAVPHAGRCYPPELLASARVSADILLRLEDRLADRLAEPLIASGHSVLVAHTPRAMIDLNRDEREVDPGGISALPPSFPVLASAKVRGGLGLVPRRLPHAGELWRAPLPYAELRARIESIHRPYHRALADLLRLARETHGTALLIDLHSMPPLANSPHARPPAPRIVLGDRFGRSAAPRLSAIALQAAEAAGENAALNHPYPGSHSLDRHGRPWHGIHAIQLEVDRTLYLDDQQVHPGAGLARTQHMVGHIVQALAGELASFAHDPSALAAE